MLSLSANAYNFEVDGIYYEITSSSSPYEVAVTYKEYKDTYLYAGSYSGEIVIPSSVTYNNVTYSVKSIGNSAFCLCSGLTSVTIPNSVTSIGSSAFSHCSSLNSLEIPSSVLTIGTSAFNNCTGITSLVIPNSVTSLGNAICSNCTGLESVTLSNSIESIERQTFQDCASLNSILIPNSVISIDYAAFDGCTGLSTVTIGNSVTDIGEKAFYNCSNLTSITIPNSVKSIGDHAFYGCTLLTSVMFEPNSALTYIGNSAFRECTFTSVTIPKSVITIDCWAFCRCDNLSSLSFENGSELQTIGQYAFYGIPITTLTIPQHVTSIGISAFDDCSNLTTLIYEEGTQKILRAQVGGRYPVQNVVIPSTATVICEKAFYSCSKLKSITLPPSLQSIESSAFYGSGLTSITIPNSVTSIGVDAFRLCYFLTSVVLKSIPTFGNDKVFDEDYKVSITLELTDDEKPYIADVTTNAPTISSGKYIRTLAKGKWGSIVLPFVPDNVYDYKFYTLKEGDTETLTFTEVESDEVEAGVPYLYKNANDEDIKTEMVKNSAVTMTVNTIDPDAVGNWRLKGAFRTISEVNTSYYVLSNNQFWNSTSTVTINPFRAYLVNSSSALAKMIIEIEGEGGESTRIDASQIEGMETLGGEVYDLSGRRVMNPQKGIYIVNGKKVMF